MRQNQRIGIMGGTFDPIHFGHLVTAEAARCRFSLDKVIFVPSGMPPHKQNRPVTPGEERLMMTLLATVANPHFVVSAYEVERPQMSYTYDTVQEFHRQYGDAAELFHRTLAAF